MVNSFLLGCLPHWLRALGLLLPVAIQGAPRAHLGICEKALLSQVIWADADLAVSSRAQETAP